LCRRVALHARGYQRYCKMLGTAYKATWRHSPEDQYPRLHRRENLKSYTS
jgi:hypothetical protein